MTSEVCLRQLTSDGVARAVVTGRQQCPAPLRLSCSPVARRNSLRRPGLHLGPARRFSEVGARRVVEPRAVTPDAAGAEAVYEGVYGPWKLETRDRVEVFLYRAALVAVSASLVAASLPAFLPPDSAAAQVTHAQLDALYWTAVAALGASLALIHIYVSPIKRTLQALWAIGVLGSLALSLSLPAQPGLPPDAETSTSLVLHVLEHPEGVWAVGPAFAALTGLVIKEGLCYGKMEAAALAVLIPALLLGHLSGVLSPEVEKGLLGAWVLLSSVFALRKFTQPVKDDIGDKSVFVFQALPPGEQEQLLQELERAGRGARGT